MDNVTILKRVKKILLTELSSEEFTTWFEPLSLKSMENQLILVVPNKFFSEWITEKYWHILTQACDKVMEKKVGISFEINSSFSNQVYVSESPKIPTKIVNSGLVPRYIFSSFIVGPCNELAYAACHAVANNPGKLYNPLFIFGSAGLGKTHLLTAAGNYLKDHHPNLGIKYNTLEGFTNELISAIRYEGINSFQDKYRNVDCLLIDDIQLLAGRERTQEELFHTFNALYDSGKQIIVTSDKMPKEIPGLEKRLRTRFEWGLLADLQPPEDETKTAIIQEKANSIGLDLSKNVIHYLTKQPENNIRVLEGYLTRIKAISQLKNQEITLELTKGILGPLVGESLVSPEEILKAISTHFSVKVSDLKSKKKTRNITLPRQIAMYLIRRLTKLSYPEIGKIMGGKDHSTVVKGVKKLEEVIKKNQEISDQVKLVEKALIGRRAI